jgi:hypothetical protein
MTTAAQGASKKSETATRQKALILAPFADFVANEDLDGLFEYLAHCGINATSKVAGLEHLILEHYQVGARQYDIERAADDLRRWPPIAARIKELEDEKAAASQAGGGQAANSQMISKTRSRTSAITRQQWLVRPPPARPGSATSARST